MLTNPDPILTECCQLPLCTYGLALNWRLLEILPPPQELLKDLSLFIHLLTIKPSQKTVINLQSVSKIFLSPSYYLYLIILLDRIQQNPTQPTFQFSSGFATDDSLPPKSKSESSTVKSTNTSAITTGGGNANIPSVTSSRSSMSSSSAYSLLDSRANLLKELKRLIHAQCSSKLSNDGESEEAKANVIEGAINKLISLVHPIALFSFLFECGFLQVKSFSLVLDSIKKSFNGITVGQLSYLCSLFQFLGTLTSQLSVLNDSKSTKPLNTSKSYTDTVEPVKRAGKHRTRHAAGKGRTVCSTETTKQSNNSIETTTPKEKKSICLLDTAVLDSTLQDTLVSSVNSTIGNSTNTSGDKNLTSKELSAMYSHSLHTGHNLLITSLQIMYKLCYHIRSELGLPNWNDVYINESFVSGPSTIENIGSLTLLCPNRLMKENYLPFNFTSNLLARRRLANSLRLATVIYGKQFGLLNEVATKCNSNKCIELNQFNSNLSQCFYQILTYQYELTVYQLTTKNDHSSDDGSIKSSNATTSTVNETKSTTANTTPEFAKHLANRLKLFQACCLLKHIYELCTSLVKQLFNLQEKICYSNDFDIEPTMYKESHYGLQLIATMHYDPIFTALHIDLICNNEEVEKMSLSVAQYLAYLCCIHRTMSTSKLSSPCKINNAEGQVKKILDSCQLKKLISRSLEDRLVYIVCCMARCLSNSGKSPLESRVCSYVCREVMGFLEVVLGNHRILKQFLLSPSSSSSIDVNRNNKNITMNENSSSVASHDSNTQSILTIIQRTIFNKELFMSLFSSSSMSRIPHQDVYLLNGIRISNGPPSLTYQMSSLRLLCVLLMRAINASSKTRCNFTELVKLALESCIFNPWKSLVSETNKTKTLSSYWLENILPNMELFDQNNDTELWFTDLLNNHNYLLSHNQDSFLLSFETEEDLLTNDIFNSTINNINTAYRNLNCEDHVNVNWLLDANVASMVNNTTHLINEWKQKRCLYYIALYFERFTRLLTSNWTDDVSLREKYCNHLLTSAISIWRSRVTSKSSRNNTVTTTKCSKSPSSSTSITSAAQEEPENVKQSATVEHLYDLTFLPYAITSLHCLSFGFTTGSVHSKLFGFFTYCANICYELIMKPEINKEVGELVCLNDINLLLSMSLQHYKQASLICSLQSIYFYISTMIVVLNPNCQPKPTDNIYSSLMNATSSSVRLDYWPNFVYTQPGLFSNTFMNNDESENSYALPNYLAKSFYSKTRAFSHLLSFHFTHNCKSAFRKNWNQLGLWNVKSHLPNVSAQSNEFLKTKLTYEIDQLSDNDISDDFDDCLEDEVYSSFPGPLINDSMCTYVATQKMFIDQHWYHCFTCNLQESHGVCSVCAKVCHSGHDLSYAKFSGFFCDCGAGQNGDSFCQAMTSRVISNKDSFPVNMIKDRNNIFLQYMNDKELNYYLPWLTDGYHPFILSPASSKEFHDPYHHHSSISNANATDGHRTSMHSVIDRHDSRLIPLGSKLVKRRRKESSSLIETQDDTAISRPRSVPGINNSGVNASISSDTSLNAHGSYQSTNQSNIRPLWRPITSVGGTDSFATRSSLSHQQTSSSVSNRPNNLRRTGAVRLRKISSDVHSGPRVLKTFQMTQQQSKISITQPTQQNVSHSSNHLSHNIDKSCKPSVIIPITSSISSRFSPCYDNNGDSIHNEQDIGIRIRNIHHFLNVCDNFNCNAIKRKRKYSKRLTANTTTINTSTGSLETDSNRFHYTQLVPNEMKLIEHVRRQVSVYSLTF
ncbi:unnamed protein product [Schistosoma mattheei]|uniref:Uncharacterized protein n=1 Tax=Schistosoma mattheei TaxID=31246 RepID=A0A183NW45_9TREM|nr:unnamed protein product [Schistosoma mattheei]